MKTLRNIAKVLSLSLGLMTGTALCAVDCPETLASFGHPGTTVSLFLSPQRLDEELPA